MKKYNYPIFTPKLGILTDKMRDAYLKYNIKQNKTPYDVIGKPDITSLIASNFTEHKLYIWQLYSILGEKPIELLIRTFYTNLLNDKHNSFMKNELLLIGDIEYHIKNQINFWIDIMGGGRRYKENRVNQIHLVKIIDNIISRNDSYRWIMHMHIAMYETKLNKFNDIRVFNCLKEYLMYFRERYSIEFDYIFFDKNILNMESKL